MIVMQSPVRTLYLTGGMLPPTSTASPYSTTCASHNAGGFRPRNDVMSVFYEYFPKRLLLQQSCKPMRLRVGRGGDTFTEKRNPLPTAHYVETNCNNLIPGYEARARTTS